MTVPIDYADAPIREKNLEGNREFAFWFIFGEHENGNVDIHCQYGDVITNVPPEAADEILAARGEFMSVILKHLSYG